MSFEAKYHGTCDHCGEHIAPGDQATYAQDGSDYESGVLIHVDCETAVRRERPVVVCPICHLTRPCDCEAS